MLSKKSKQRNARARRKYAEDPVYRAKHAARMSDPTYRTNASARNKGRLSRRNTGRRERYAKDFEHRAKCLADRAKYRATNKVEILKRDMKRYASDPDLRRRHREAARRQYQEMLQDPKKHEQRKQQQKVYQARARLRRKLGL